MTYFNMMHCDMVIMDYHGISMDFRHFIIRVNIIYIFYIGILYSKKAFAHVWFLFHTMYG